MTDPAHPAAHRAPADDRARPDHARVDPERPREPKPFNQADEFTGEDYSIAREAAEGRGRPSGQEDRVATGGDPATPPATDNRASFDPATGAVHGQELPEDGGLPSRPR